MSFFIEVIMRYLIILYCNANRVGGHNENNRYEPSTEMESIWKSEALKESKKIILYIKLKKK